MDPIQKSRKNQSEMKVPKIIIKLCKALYSFIKKALTFPPFAAAGTALTYNEGSTPRKEARERTEKIFSENRVKHYKNHRGSVSIIRLCNRKGDAADHGPGGV